MEEIGKSLRKLVPRERNPHLHSEIHLLVDEARNLFGETAKKGPGSFSFYLGFFKRLGAAKVHQILAEVRQSDASDPKRLFWWKIKQESDIE